MPVRLYNHNWTPSSDCVKLIQHFEGYNLQAYQGDADRPGVITIGWGSVMYQNGSKVRLGDRITKEEADNLLLWEIGLKAVAVNGMVKECMISQNQFDSLVSFAYNLGIGALQGSTLLKKVRRNPLDPSIKDEFLKWVNSNGKKVSGLVRRRKSEAHLYFEDELEFYE